MTPRAETDPPNGKHRSGTTKTGAVIDLLHMRLSSTCEVASWAPTAAGRSPGRSLLSGQREDLVSDQIAQDALFNDAESGGPVVGADSDEVVIGGERCGTLRVVERDEDPAFGFA
jgi:hypothetical protein